MADTPRVTVPVEPTPEMIEAGAGKKGVSAYRAMLSAAPAPEGGAVLAETVLEWLKVRGANNYRERFGGDPGAEAEEREERLLSRMADLSKAALATREEAPAEWFGVTGAVDETEALAVALFAVRCPGVRMTDEDLHHYRSAAQRAMQVVSAELSGNPGQLEAPAEAGELIAHLEAYRPHLADEGIGSIYVSMTLTQLDALLSALHAQPPAREDAQPVPFIVGNQYRTQSGDLVRFVSVHRAGTSYETMADEDGVHRYTMRDFGRVTGTDHGYSDPRNTPPLYTHPAPDALRVAVEALEAEKEWHERVADFAFDEARECSERGEESYETTAMTKANAHTERAAIITKVLAALQAEQGAK